MPTAALLKTPSSAFRDGITSQSLGAPDLARALQQHEAYRQALKSLGLETLVLPPDSHPDSCFVEDMAVVGAHSEGSGGFLLATRSEPRAHEQPPVMEALRQKLPDYREVAIPAPARLDGGDVLRMGRRWLVGLTARTDQAGFEAFRQVVEAQGDSAEPVAVRGMLHLKTGVSRLDDETVLSLPILSETFRGLGFRTLEVSPEDWHAANVLAFDSKVLLPAGHPRVVETLTRQGFQALEVDLSEFKKQDGGASCLSILLP